MNEENSRASIRAREAEKAHSIRTFLQARGAKKKDPNCIQIRVLLWCRKWDSALRVRSACAPRSACAAAALPGPYKSPTGAFAIRGFESLIAKQKPPRGDGSLFWCRKWDSNPHGGLAQRILSPPRLPIPSFRQAAISARSAHSVYFNIPARELQARRSVFHCFSPWRLCAILINRRVLRHQGRALYGDGSFAF